MSNSPSIRHLRDFIAIPSVNPMGRSDIPAAIAGERRYAEHLFAAFRKRGFDTAIVGDPDRPSVIAEVRAQGARETVMIASHLDTVPIDHMEIDPFDPRIQGERLYGRGACDTKAGMATLLAAVDRVLERGKLRRNLLLVGEADEELTSHGVADVLAHLGTKTPDWAIATEPTELHVVSHHKGVALATLRARGRAVHSSRPAEGRNAIVELARAVLALDALGSELGERPDPELGPGTCSIGMIRGGHSPNIVPDEAHLTLDRRLLPGEDASSFRTELESALANHGVRNVEIEDCHVEKPPLATPHDTPAVHACMRTLRSAGLPADPATAAFGTDAGLFAERGIPGVVWGPGSIAQAHTSSEYIELAQVEAMEELFVVLLSAE